MKNQKPLGKYEISPFNEELMKLMKPFVSKEQLKPAMTGVNFDENGIAATDGHLLLVFHFKKSDDKRIKKATYDIKTSRIINETYPNYPDATPSGMVYFAEMETEQVIKALTVENMKIKEFEKICSKFVFTANHVTITHFGLDIEERSSEIPCRSNAVHRTIAFNNVLFLKICHLFTKLNIPKFKIYFERYSRAATMFPSSVYGNITALIMPVMLKDVMDNLGYFNDKNNLPENDTNEFSENMDTPEFGEQKPFIQSEVHLKFEAERLLKKFKDYIYRASLFKELIIEHL